MTEYIIVTDALFSSVWLAYFCVCNNVMAMWVGLHTLCFSMGWKPVKHALLGKLVLRLYLQGDLTGF